MDYIQNVQFVSNLDEGPIWHAFLSQKLLLGLRSCVCTCFDNSMKVFCLAY